MSFGRSIGQYFGRHLLARVGRRLGRKNLRPRQHLAIDVTFGNIHFFVMHERLPGPPVEQPHPAILGDLRQSIDHAPILPDLDESGSRR
jgi:hypothetical protein